jgi:hypothetical protein
LTYLGVGLLCKKKIRCEKWVTRERGREKKNVEIGKRDRGKTTNRLEKVFTMVSIYKKK